MTVARLYIMRAADEKADAIKQALADAADLVRNVPGCEGVELLHDTENENRFVFIEKWDSIDSHKQAPEHLPKGALDGVMAAIAGPPDGSYLDYVKTV